MLQTFNIIAFFRMKKVLVYNLDALLRTVIHCLITNALIAFFILIYSGTSHFHLFFTSTLCVDLIVLQILKDINVKHYSREKGLKMGPDNITVWNPIEQVLHEFFRFKFIQVVFWQKTKHCQRHNGPEGWVHITQILIKFHLQNLEQV